MQIPKEFKAAAARESFITTIAMMEGLGVRRFGIKGYFFAINAHQWTTSIPLLMYRTEEQKRKYHDGLCDGEFDWSKRNKRAGGWVRRILNANPRI